MKNPFFNACLLLFFLLPTVQAQTSQTLLQQLDQDDAWADSVLASMSLEEQIGQLMMVAAYSDERANAEHLQKISELIEKYHIGGLVFFQGGPMRQAKLQNHYQALAKVPLLIALDAEWGLGMRLDSTISFPYQMALGAVQDDLLLYEMGQEVARQFKRLGMHVNFAPVADVNNNPKNPVISYRSFGENPELVAQKVNAYATGMQDGGIIVTLKHFPGHGDTDTDSHYDLPVIKHNRERLNSLEILPFRKNFESGISGVMSAHLSIPQLDSTTNLPSTLSERILGDILRKELAFKGLVFTDAMNMKGVTKYYQPGEAALLAIKAGNDLLEYVPDVPKAISHIKKAVENGEIPAALITEKCRRVLKAKKWLGLDNYQPVQTENLFEDLNTGAAKSLQQRLASASLTLLKNEGVLPLSTSPEQRILSISVGAETVTPFQQQLSLYQEVEHIKLGSEASAAAVQKALKKAQAADKVIVALHQTGTRPRNNPGYGQAVLHGLTTLFNLENVVACFFRNPYALAHYPNIGNSAALLLAYQGDDFMQEMAAQALFGAVPINGKLPVTASPIFTFGKGMGSTGGLRLRYSQPEVVGIDGEKLYAGVEKIVVEAIEEQAFPGCQVLIAKNGHVVLNEAYGYHTYAKKQPVEKTDLYDLASITKITGPLPALMKLHGEGKLDLDAPFRRYWPDFEGTNKAQMTVREVLAHHAQLKPYIPYYLNTFKKNGKFKWFTFKPDSSKRFPVKTYDGLYLHRKYIKKIYKAIKESPLNAEREYVYSGLSFLLYPQIIENLTGQPYEAYVRENFYDPIGAKRLTFNPLNSYSREAVVPTEYDSTWRKQLTHGYVHDEAAAMLGGVSGNAGLFANANDLAKLMQLYLNLGRYGGQEFIPKATMKKFTSYQFREEGSRRGLGFDKPRLKNIKNGFPAPQASTLSFGHSGFTGTFTWADPETGILLVFLSNRVHPTRENRKAYSLDVYQRIHSLAYHLGR